MRIAFVAVILSVSVLKASMNLDWGAVAALVAVLSLVISVINSRGKTNTEFIQRTVKGALAEFRELLEEKLDKKFDNLPTRFIDRDTLNLRFESLKADIKHECEARKLACQQIDHRVSRNSEQVGMLLSSALESGMLKSSNKKSML